MEPLRNWEASGNFDGNPMAEFQPKFGEVGSQKDIPPWQIVEEN